MDWLDGRDLLILGLIFIIVVTKITSHRRRLERREYRQKFVEDVSRKMEQDRGIYRGLVNDQDDLFDKGGKPLL